MFRRALSEECLSMAQKYPVVTITGPRQSGKTTLVKTLFPNKPYVSLENIDERALADVDPKGFLERFPGGAILDEIQRQPQLLSYIQGIVDEVDKKGMFILTGSHQMALSASITQSLAGRTAILTLLPLSIAELQQHQTYSLDRYLLQGMFPRIYQDDIDATKFYRDYVRTYVERDVRQLLNVKNLAVFQKFLKLCAARVGQVFNSSNLSNELGVSYHTVNEWLSILEASFVVIKLQPYYENFGKRIIKSPKLYFTDVGLAAYLLDIETVSQIERDPLRGGLVENFVIMECIKHLLNQGKEPHFYYFRDHKGNEVDLLIKQANQLIPVEIKSSQTFNLQFLKHINYFKQLAGDRYHQGFLIYNGNQEQQIEDIYVRKFSSLTDIFEISSE